jgi:hypothetical protein
VNVQPRHLTFVVLACLGLCATASKARGNAAARSFFTQGKSAGALAVRAAGAIRVAEVSLLLDFRESGRQASTAEYLLVNLDQVEEWEDEVIFLSSAPSVTISVDGRDVPVKQYGRSFERSPQIEKALSPRVEGNGFRIHLGPGQRLRVVVTFVCEPAVLTSNLHYEWGADGLTRWDVSGRPGLGLDRRSFTYPLWPAYGFGGGVGEMAIAVLTSKGATPPKDGPSLAWTRQELPEGETRWTIRLPGAASVDMAPMRDVDIDYPQPRRSRWSFGASVFAGARFATRNERLVSPHLGLSADAIVTHLGMLSLGAETGFNRSGSLSLAFQRGAASPMVSLYLGGALLASLAPHLTPGFEARAGIRLLWLPVDLALQAHPWATPGEGRVARFRVIAGVRLGAW